MKRSFRAIDVSIKPGAVQVMEPVTAVGWFIISTLAGLKDRTSDLHRGMTETLDRLATVAENEARRQPPSRSPDTTD